MFTGLIIYHLSVKSRCHSIPRVHIFVNALAIFGNADLIVALRNLNPERIADQIIHGCFRFLLIGPAVKLGYSVSGDTRFECIFFLYGETTRNGKGTFMESILLVMGDYGRDVRPEGIENPYYLQLHRGNRRP